jgi:hypothetical protein
VEAFPYGCQVIPDQQGNGVTLVEGSHASLECDAANGVGQLRTLGNIICLRGAGDIIPLLGLIVALCCSRLAQLA